MAHRTWRVTVPTTGANLFDLLAATGARISPALHRDYVLQATNKGTKPIRVTGESDFSAYDDLPVNGSYQISGHGRDDDTFVVAVGGTSILLLDGTGF